ncbi:MAG: Maf family protein, partial [Oscillospiraceae bacterium]|nr:Maf family protein [Oscillospiraceae bacterium]
MTSRQRSKLIKRMSSKPSDSAGGGRIGLVLGSASPRRASLLSQIGADFEIRVADADETIEDTADPGAYVKEIAGRKAAAVAALINSDDTIHNKYDRVIVIGADTIVVAPGGGIFGKPSGSGDARRMLASLSGQWHEVYTGVALIESHKMNAPERSIVETRPAGSWHDAPHPGGSRFTGYQPDDTRFTGYQHTRVKMCALSEDAINHYVETGEPLGKAGAYAIQGAGALFVERVEGCFFNVVGLPLRLLCDMLYTLGYDLQKN